MQRTPSWQHVHFIGLGGVGMNGIATILADLGISVSGSDATPSPGLERLRGRGLNAVVGHKAENLPPETDMVVFSSAVAATNPEMVEAQRRDLKCMQRGKFLAELATAFRTVIAVAGSHGKTTTTAMIAHILRECDCHPGYLIGGDMPGWPAPAAAGKSDILVTEVDESDGTQAYLRSAIGVIINIEDDHSWSLGGIEKLEQCFVDFANGAATVLAWRTAKTEALLASHPGLQMLDRQDIPAELELQVRGAHNRINATLAVAAANACGIPHEAATAALKTFTGVARRMTEHYRSPDDQLRIIEDYAHHPTELKALLDTLRTEFPEHHLTAIFQPHRFERVKRYAAEFASLISTADEAIVVQPFAAWITDDEIADPRTIADQVKGIPAIYWQEGLPSLAAHLMRAREKTRPAVIAVIGAGDIGTLIPPLISHLLNAQIEQDQADIQRACPELDLSRKRTWAELTTLRIGQARPLLARPNSESQLAALLRHCHNHRLPIGLLGNGSNLVGTDAEQRQLTIQLTNGEFSQCQYRATQVLCGAGLSLAALCNNLMRDHKLPANAAPLAWIPASVAGAVKMNAGAHGSSIADFVTMVRGLDHDGNSCTWNRQQITWNYRQCEFPTETIITQVQLEFPAPTQAPEQTRQAAEEIARQRRKTQPHGHNAGCVFRNPGQTAAGKLLDDAGCKNLRRAHCFISPQHANFIIAEPGATEKDFVTLLLQAQRQVFDRTGIRLLSEVRFANASSARHCQQALPPLHVAVLKGGPSAEREISLKSGGAVADALRAAGHRVSEITIKGRELPPLHASVDVVFPVLHGVFGEDGEVQERLEELNLPYVGTGPEASHRIMSKVATKETLLTHGVPTPRYRVVPRVDSPLPTGFAPPLMVKPDTQGSTVGMTCLKQYDDDAWRNALEQAFATDTMVFIEVFVTGIEITVGVLNGQALPVVEIVPPDGRIFDFDAKYAHTRGHTQYLCPPQSLTPAVQEKARELAVETFQIMNARDMLRVDFMVDDKGTPWVLEANSIPGFTATSLLPFAARQTGVTFEQLCASLVMRAWKRAVQR